MGKYIKVSGKPFADKRIKSLDKTDGYVKYLQGDGNSWINTLWSGYRNNSKDVSGTIPSDVPKIEIGIMGSIINGHKHYATMIVGNASSNTVQPCIYEVNMLQGKGAVKQSVTTPTDRSSNAEHIIIYGADKSYYDGVMIADNSNGANQYRLNAYPNNYFTLWRGYYGANYGVLYGNARITYVKCYEGNTLVHHFRPYVKDGAGCMKDEVDGTFYMNEGSGSFLMGERI